MTQKETGGPAYPNKHGYLGMTLRDYFAGKALVGIVADERFERLATSAGVDWDYLTGQLSYEIADAMIAARDAE